VVGLWVGCLGVGTSKPLIFETFETFALIKLKQAFYLSHFFQFLISFNFETFRGVFETFRGFLKLSGGF
jgi:hypothetical protein